MPHEISPSRERKEQFDQSQTRDVSPSRKESFNYTRHLATLNDLQLRGGGGEQTHQLDQDRKGKKPEFTDGVGEKPNRENHPVEKIVLPGKSGLRGGGNELGRAMLSDFQAAEAHAARDINQLETLAFNYYSKNKAEKQKYKARVAEIEEKRDDLLANLEELTLERFKAKYPQWREHANEDFLKDFKKSIWEDHEKEIEKLVRRDPKLAKYLKKYGKSHTGFSDQGASSSRG